MLPFSNYKFYAPQNTHPRVRETWTHARIVRGRKGSIDNKFTPIVKKKKERDNFFSRGGKTIFVDPSRVWVRALHPPFYGVAASFRSSPCKSTFIEKCWYKEKTPSRWKNYERKKGRSRTTRPNKNISKWNFKNFISTCWSIASLLARLIRIIRNTGCIRRKLFERLLKLSCDPSQVIKGWTGRRGARRIANAVPFVSPLRASVRSGLKSLLLCQPATTRWECVDAPMSVAAA